MVQKAGERVHVRSTPSATRNDLVMLHGYIVLGVVQRSIWLNDEREGEFALFQERSGGWHGVKR